MIWVVAAHRDHPGGWAFASLPAGAELDPARFPLPDRLADGPFREILIAHGVPDAQMAREAIERGINEGLFASKKNKFMVFNGAGVDSWRLERTPVTKTKGVENMLLGTLK